jgi:flavocytochrome c
MRTNQRILRGDSFRDPVARADVIVIGSGYSGLAAAIEAGNAGASVIIFEKRKGCGGNSIISSGMLAAVGSPIQEREGISDSPELMYKDMLRAGRGRNDPALVKVVAENSGQILWWTINELGVAYKDMLEQSGGHSVPRSHIPYNASGSAIIRPLLAKAKGLGVEIRTKTRLTRLLKNSSGAIKGVETADESQTLSYVRAGKAVVLAAGGFAGDVHFRALHDSRLTEDIGNTNRPGTTAETLIEAMRVGAKAVDLSCIQLLPWTSPDEKSFGFGALFASCGISPYGILINPTTGRRFVNELADRKTCVDAILRIGRPCIGIADTNGLKSSDYVMKNINYNIEKYIQRGVVKRFGRSEDIAGACNIPHKSLEDTLIRFNNYVKTSRDPDFKKPFLKAARPVVPPYYVIRVWPKVHHTMGGLRINTKAQALNSKDEPIKGLYAAGEVTGGIHGASRLSDCATTECLIFGRIAGRNAALEP